MESDLLRVYPNLKGKTCVIYNPISEHIVNYQQGEKKRKENYLLCVGRLVRQKNFSHAIQAFSIYSKKNPDCQLKIIGTGDQEDALKKLAKKLEIEDKVQFLGFKQDVRPYYLKAKATILSSNYEGFPNVLLESIALGTPVVAYDCPSGPAEIIQEGVNGFLVEHLNIKALSSALIALDNHFFDPEKIIQTSKKFNSREIIEQYEKTLLSVK